MSDQPPTQPTPPPGGANWQGVQPVVERPTEAVPPVPPPVPPPAPPGPAGGGPTPGGSGGGNGKLIAIAVLVLAIVGVGGFLLFAGGDDDEGDERGVLTRDDEDEDADEDEGTTTTGAEDTTTTAGDLDTTTTAGGETTTSVPGELAFTRVTDDSGVLVVEVPDTWTDVDGTPLGDGAPNLQASTDLQAFRQLSASGISYTLLNQENADPDATLDFLTASHVDNCEVRDREDYSDGVFEGRLQRLSNCGGRGVELIVIVASNAAGRSVEVSTIFVPPDPVEEIEQHIIETFNLTE